MPRQVRYPALIDGEHGAYGVVFPDLPGIVAMGETIDEAIANAAEALVDAAVEAALDGKELPPPSKPEEVHVSAEHILTMIPLLRLTGKAKRANLTLDEGVLEFIDAEARRRGMTRKAFVEWMARFVAKTAA